MSDIIQRIKQKLAYLREHEDYDVTDANSRRISQVYAARKHHYTLKPPATDSQIAAFEAQHGIELPEDYRQFLLEVGRGGAGPGYEMFSPFKATTQAENENNTWNADPYTGDLQQPFPFTDDLTPEEIESLIELILEQKQWDEVETLLSAGHLMIAYGGCQCWSLLVICGVARGQVWDNDGLLYSPVKIADGRIYSPLYDSVVPEDAQTATFTVWYEAWLDEEIVIARGHWQKRGRVVPPFTLGSSG